MPQSRIPRGVEAECLLTLVTAWPVGVVDGSLFVHLEEGPESLCDDAMRNGAALILAQRQIKDYPCLVVPNATDAYVRLCATLKRRTPVRTVAVTGSIGKTTTKEMLDAVYRQHFRHVFTNPDNSNMYYMIGHYTQLLPTGCERYIQECHEGDPASAATISRMIEPDIAIVTNIGSSHAARFGSPKALIDEVSGITAGMPDNGIVVYSADSENARLADFKRASVTVGVQNQEADYVAVGVVADKTGIRFQIQAAEPEGAADVHLRMTGEHNVSNALLVWAAARADGVPPEQIAAGLRSYVPHGVRQNVVQTSGSRTIHIDCYNAAPESMASAVAHISSRVPLGETGRRVAVLGNMEELGERSTDDHREIGALIARSPIDILITYGNKARDIATQARHDGCPKVILTHDRRSLVSTIRREVQSGDAVLLKASHSMHFDRVLLGAFPSVYLRHIVPEMAKSVLRRFAIAANQ